MFYIIYARDINNSLEKRISLLPMYLTRLRLLQDEGRLLTAGSMPAVDSNDPGNAGFKGSIVIAEFKSLEAAQSWIDLDPYVTAGIYNTVMVNPYKKVF